jgi:hypothetical protein
MQRNVHLSDGGGESPAEGLVRVTISKMGFARLLRALRALAKTLAEKTVRQPERFSVNRS